MEGVEVASEQQDRLEIQVYRTLHDHGLRIRLIYPTQSAPRVVAALRKAADEIVSMGQP